MMLQAVAHDVKNKLSELALRLMETDIEAAALALDAADQLSQALLLDSPDQLTAHVDSATPADLVDELAAVNEQLFPSKKITVDTVSAPTLWFYDVALMRLALANVVHNALKHCRSAVNLRVCEHNGQLVFEVRDDGAGFDARTLDTDWSDLTATNISARHSLGYNTGLGLVLAHRIVTAHIHDKEGISRTGTMKLSCDQGAVVRLTLP
jgi:signal transduction histidine kinase